MANEQENQKKPKRTTPKSDSRTQKRLDRGKRIIALRASGASLRQISEILTAEAEKAGISTRGLSHQAISNDLKWYRGLQKAEISEAVEEMRATNTERLESLILHYGPYSKNSIDGLTASNLVQMKRKAADVIIKAIRELNDMYGTRQPQKLEHSGPDGSPINLQTQVILQFTDEIETEDE